jgi:hypothetical protein
LHIQWNEKTDYMNLNMCFPHILDSMAKYWLMVLQVGWIFQYKSCFIQLCVDSSWVFSHQYIVL